MTTALSPLERAAPLPELRYRTSRFESLSVHELYACLALRAEIFVVEQACPHLDPDGHDADAEHLLGQDAHGVLGSYARLFVYSDDPRPHRIGRVVVHSALRGTGEGRRLLGHAIAHCLQRDARAIELSAQTHLERFYASLGFVAISEPYSHDGIEHIDMRRD